MVEGKCSGEILARRCEMNHSKCTKLREVWICWEKPTVTAWPTSPAQEAPAAAAAAAGNTQDPQSPPSHTPHGGRWSQGWLGFPSCDPWQSSISPLGSSQHKQVTDTGSRNSEPHLHQPLFPLNSSPKQAKLSASQRSLHVPEHASPRQPWTTLHRLVLFQLGCRNCLEPLKRIQLCIHCISGLWH